MRTSSPKPIWPALLPVISCMMFFIGFEIGGFQLVLRSVSSQFSMAATGSGLLVAAQNIGVVMMPLLFGSLSDRIGKRRVLLIFAALFMAGCAAAALAGSATAFVMGVFLIGAGYSVCECTASAALSDAYPEKSAQYINLSQCMFSLGAVASPILIRYGMSGFDWSWRSVFVICAGAYVLLMFPLLRVRFSAPPAGTSPVEAPPAGAAPKARVSLFAFFRNDIFLLLFLSILLYIGLESGVGYFIETLFTLKLGQEALGAYAISAFWAMTALSRLVFGLMRLSPKRALLVSFGASAALIVLLAVLRLPLLSLIVCGLIGFVFGPVWPLLIDLAAKQFPHNSGGAIGLMSAGCGLGGIAFPAVIGFLADHTDLRLSFLLLSLTALAAGSLCLVMTTREKRRQASKNG